MTARAYLSTLSVRWPIDRQEAEHAAKTPGWPDVPTYRDKLSARACMAHAVASLKERKGLLRPTSRRDGEVIYVASLAVLAIGAADFMDVCAAAEGRGAAIVAHETETRIDPGSSADKLRDALATFLHSKRRFQRTHADAGRAGAAASATRRAEDVQCRAELIREDWGKREVPTATLLARAGRKPKGRRDIVPMSYQTAAALLGKRPAAQKKREVDTLREQRRQEALKNGRG